MPTSPVNPSSAHEEIEAVFGDGDPALTSNPPAATLLSEWRQLGAFLRRPNLAQSGGSKAPFTMLGRIYALDVLAMLALVAMAMIAVAMGVYIPETALAGFEFTPLVILGVVVAAPVLEEIVFRSWLSGHPGPIIALLSIVTGGIGFGIAHISAPIVGVLLVVAGLLGAIIALVLLRNRPPMGWFAAIFPGIFWFSAIAFALVHIANFDPEEAGGSWLVLLPLVLPQFILGALLGYVRVKIGLWSAIVLHSLHNGTAMGIALLASLAE